MHGGIRIVLIAAVIAAAGAGAAALAACGGQAELDGTRWKLVAWSVSSAAPGDFSITADFADGRISGSSAVNHYGGSYKADGNGHFSVGSLVSTEMAGPPAAMHAEAVFIELLQQARKYRLAGGSLSLMNDSGAELLVFSPRE